MQYLKTIFLLSIIISVSQARNLARMKSNIQSRRSLRLLGFTENPAKHNVKVRLLRSQKCQDDLNAYWAVKKKIDDDLRAKIEGKGKYEFNELKKD